MTQYNKATGTTQTLRTREGAETKHASYTAELVFKKGKATVNVDADLDQGKWTVVNVSVQPPTTMRPVR